jgi:hypothetical protein
VSCLFQAALEKKGEEEVKAVDLTAEEVQGKVPSDLIETYSSGKGVPT